MGVCVCVFMKSTRGQMFNNLVGFCFFSFVVAFRVTQTQSPNVPTFAFKVVISHPTRSLSNHHPIPSARRGNRTTSDICL